jgi:hypothetical protein
MGRDRAVTSASMRLFVSSPEISPEICPELTVPP